MGDNMDIQYEAGDKIQYRLFDKKGKGTWFDGVIHAVRRYEDPKTNMITGLTYLVDTGRDTRVDEFPFNHRDREINRRTNALIRKGGDPDKSLMTVLKHTDLPDSKQDVERVRQPEQIELAPEHIKRG